MVSPERMHGRGLRPLLAIGFGEADRRAGLEPVEASVHHGVAMEIYLAAVRRLYEAVVVRRR